MTLVCSRKILTTMIHDWHISIPLDVSDVRVLSKQIIYYIKYEILHFWITEIEYQLSTTTTNNSITLRSLDNPIWMFFVEFTLGIGHFRLNPNTKLHTIFLCIAEQTFNTIRQLFGIYNPITQSSIVSLTRIFFTEPSIIHNEQLTTHAMNVCHHLIHSLLVDVEINTLPRIQENISLLITMSKNILTSPLMEITASTAQTFIRISKCKSWSFESFALFKVILRVLFIDTSKEVVILGIIGYGFEFIISSILKRCTDYRTRIFLSPTIQREHNLSMVGMRISSTIIIADNELTRLQFFMTQLCFSCPCTRKMTHPYISTTDRKHSRCKCSKGNSSLLTVSNLCPCFNHINIIV